MGTNAPFYPGNPTDRSGRPLAATVTFKFYGAGDGQHSVEVSADPNGVFGDLVSEDAQTRASGYGSLAVLLHAAVTEMVALLS